MANDDHIAQLKNGVFAWRDDNRNIRPDLSGADLIRVGLGGANLSRVDLSGAELVWAHLVEADLTSANLTGANLTQANLARADLTDAWLPSANLKNAYLKAANFQRADVSAGSATFRHRGGRCRVVPLCRKSRPAPRPNDIGFALPRRSAPTTKSKWRYMWRYYHSKRQPNILKSLNK
jgi:hypothetical protein